MHTALHAVYWILFWGGVCLCGGASIAKLGDILTRSRFQPQLQEEPHEEPGDYLIEAIEERWLKACETDPVQLWLAAKEREQRSQAVRQWQPLREHEPPPVQMGQLWVCCSPGRTDWGGFNVRIRDFNKTTGKVKLYWLADEDNTEIDLDKLLDRYKYAGAWGWQRMPMLPDRLNSAPPETARAWA